MQIEKCGNDFIVIRDNGSKIGPLSLEEAYSITYFNNFQCDMEGIVEVIKEIPDGAIMFGDEVKDLLIMHYGKVCYKNLKQMEMLK